MINEYATPMRLETLDPATLTAACDTSCEVTVEMAAVDVGFWTAHAQVSKALVSAIPTHANKAFNFGCGEALASSFGLKADQQFDAVSASRLRQASVSPNANTPALPSQHVAASQWSQAGLDGSGPVLTTHHSVAAANHRNSLEAGMQEVMLLDDFRQRAQITPIDDQR